MNSGFDCSEIKESDEKFRQLTWGYREQEEGRSVDKSISDSSSWLVLSKICKNGTKIKYDLFLERDGSQLVSHASSLDNIACI